MNEDMKGRSIVLLVEEFPVGVEAIGRISQNGYKLCARLDFVYNVRRVEDIWW